jgi:hypothetical protein
MAYLRIMIMSYWNTSRDALWFFRHIRYNVSELLMDVGMNSNIISNHCLLLFY